MRFQHKHNRGWAIVLLIALVLFAGCNAASPADPSTQTTRPVPQANQGQSADPAWLEVTHTIRQIAGTQEITYTVAPVCTSFAPLEGLTELAAYQGKLLGAGYRVNEYLMAMGQLFQVDPAMGTLELFGSHCSLKNRFTRSRSIRRERFGQFWENPIWISIPSNIARTIILLPSQSKGFQVP